MTNIASLCRYALPILVAELANIGRVLHPTKENAGRSLRFNVVQSNAC